MLTSRPEGKTWWVWVHHPGNGGWQQTGHWARTKEEAVAIALQRVGTGVRWNVLPMEVTVEPMAEQDG